MAGEPTTPRNACVAATEAEKTDPPRERAGAAGRGDQPTQRPRDRVAARDPTG
jgi:hypothetical protein